MIRPLAGCGRWIQCPEPLREVAQHLREKIDLDSEEANEFRVFLEGHLEIPCCTIVNDYCENYLWWLPAQSFDLVITDPPYAKANGKGVTLQHEGHEKADWDDRFPSEVLGLVTGLGFERLYGIARLATYIFCEWENLWDNEKRLLLPKPASVITWHKTNSGSAGDCKREHIRDSELILFYPGPALKEFKHRPRSVLRHDPVRTRLHQTPKPVGLIKEIMKAYEFESVLDLYAGSGSAAVAAKQLGKHFVGFEASYGNCRKAMNRI